MAVQRGSFITTYRTTAAIFVITASIAGLIALLMREGTGLGRLVLCGAVGGCLAGAVWRGRRGLFVGLVVGAGVGLIAPFVYIPFWLAFNLPPAVDF